MGIKKLVKDLKKILSSDAERADTSTERIEELLGKLAKKENKLIHKLSEIKNPKKRKDLKLKLKIISTQRKKGMALLHELEKKPH